MNVLICDRCGDIDVDNDACRCGVTRRGPIDLDLHRRERDCLTPSQVGADPAPARPDLTRAALA